VQGEKGDKGDTGVGIASVVDNDDGTFTLEFTDGSSFTTDNLTGPQGPDGVGIQSIANNGDGTFTLYLTDGSTFTTDNLTGPKGDTGATGPQGIQGIQGVQGEKGDKGDTGPQGSSAPAGSMAVTVNSLGSIFVVNTGPLHPATPEWKGWTSWVVAQSITITTTGSGWVFLTASGELTVLGGNPGGYPVAVGIGTSSAGPPDQASQYFNYNTQIFPPYSVVHAYQVPSSGSYTYWLLAGGTSSQIQPGTFVAIFVPAS
jgi:hypothetical protein